MQVKSKLKAGERKASDWGWWGWTFRPLAWASCIRGLPTRLCIHCTSVRLHKIWMIPRYCYLPCHLKLLWRTVETIENMLYLVKKLMQPELLLPNWTNHIVWLGIKHAKWPVPIVIEMFSCYLPVIHFCSHHWDLHIPEVCCICSQAYVFQLYSCIT